MFYSISVHFSSFIMHKSALPFPFADASTLSSMSVCVRACVYPVLLLRPDLHELKAQKRMGGDPVRRGACNVDLRYVPVGSATVQNRCEPTCACTLGLPRRWSKGSQRRRLRRSRCQGRPSPAAAH